MMIPKIRKTKRTQTRIPLSMVKSHLVWKAKMVRTNTMAVVIPAAIRTASTSYNMLTMPRVTLSAAVKIARRMKLIGKETLRVLTHTMGKITRRVTPTPVHISHMCSLTNITLLQWSE